MHVDEPKCQTSYNASDIGLKQVCAHSRNIANIITDIVGNDSRISVILRNSRFYLSDEIRPTSAAFV